MGKELLNRQNFIIHICKCKLIEMLNQGYRNHQNGNICRDIYFLGKYYDRCYCAQSVCETHMGEISYISVWFWNSLYF